MSTNNSNNDQLITEEESFDFRKLIFSILYRWWWFAISVPICLGVAFYMCISATSIYEANGKLMVSDSKKGEVGAGGMMKEMGFLQSSTFVENEIIELKSRNLMREVVKDLGLNIRYYKEGHFRDIELYKSLPFKVKVQDVEINNNVSFFISKDKNNGFKISNLANDRTDNYQFGQLVSFEGVNFIVEQPEEPIVSGRYKVSIYTPDMAAGMFHGQLSVSYLEKGTNAISLSVTDPVPARAIDLINAIVDRYNDNGVIKQRMVSETTSDFINKRLLVINQELGDIESSAENFKKENKLTDIVSDAAKVSTKKSVVDEELLKLQMQLSLVGSIKDMFKESSSKYNLLPENLGLTDNTLNSVITLYNEQVLRRSKLLNSASESNPTVLTVNSQLSELRKNLTATIQSVERSLNLQIKNFEKENSSVDRLLASVPTQEKIYRSISRQQELKEALFLFLLQRREEAEITKMMYLPSAKLIEDPRSGAPIAPKKSMIMVIGLIVGLGLPAALIILLKLLDSKVRDVQDVEKIVNAPVLGLFPHLKDGQTDISNDDFVVTESVNLIREKVNYLVKNKDQAVIMVTSTLPGEGKSQITAFLAQSYAKAGKRVIILGADLRNPQMHRFCHMESVHTGVSSYLANLEENVKSLILHVSDEYVLDAIFGGAVPPNPTQLMSSPRFEQLVEILKKEYDYILIDTPPVGMLSDGFSIAKLCDVTVYVVRANLLDKNALRLINEFDLTERLNGLGIVVNDITINKGSYAYRYGYGYGYGYGAYSGYYGKSDKKSGSKKK